MEAKERFCAVLTPVIPKHIHVVNRAENYLGVVIIDVRKHVMTDRVQSVYYYRKIVQHVPVVKQQ